MAVTLICPNKDAGPWIRALNDLDPELDLRVWPEDGPREEIEMALTWAHPPGVLNQYPELGCISSLGAGVDHLLSDPDLPPGVPLVRIVDPALVQDMAEYLALNVLYYFRQMDLYGKFQPQKKWRPLPPRDKADFPVGIMGLGQLGSAAALTLKQLGFQVSGWKNSPASDSGLPVFTGREQLGTFLSGCRILICLLPLTPETKGILNMALFSQLPGGAFLINAARGGHLLEKDLIPALDQGILSGACLDVFETEPLPPAHPFWDHPDIRITPHASSLTRPETASPQILENLKRLRNKEVLMNRVDPQKGY